MKSKEYIFKFIVRTAGQERPIEGTNDKEINGKFIEAVNEIFETDDKLVDCKVLHTPTRFNPLTFELLMEDRAEIAFIVRAEGI